MKTNWKSFNIRMPNELIPIYVFLQNELNFFLSNSYSREILNQIDITQHRGNVWLQMRDLLKWRIKDWKIHNKTWHSYILFENLRRELESKSVSKIIWKELEKNEFKINENLFNNLHIQKLYPTRSQISNIKRSNKLPELPYEAIFNLDYTISEKQFFRMSENNICKIKVSKKDWINYEIILPSSIDHRFTGKIAKPRFFKRKKDNVYVGICSYEYHIEELENFNNILGVDIGKIKLFSAIALDKNGNISNEYINSKKLQKTQYKLENLYKEKFILYNKILQYKNLHLTNKEKYFILKEIYENISNKIVNIKKHQVQLIAYETIELAKELKCKEIHIENLRWLNSQGGKWNHSEIHSKIEEKATMYGIKVKRVSAYNSSKEHPVTKEIGEVQNRSIQFRNDRCIDRDLLAAINLAVRNTNIDLTNKLPKKVQTNRVKPKSTKKEIKEKVNKLKGKDKIVSFLSSVSEEAVTVNLEARPLYEVSTLNSLLVRNYIKLQF